MVVMAQTQASESIQIARGRVPIPNQSTKPKRTLSPLCDDVTSLTSLHVCEIYLFIASNGYKQLCYSNARFLFSHSNGTRCRKVIAISIFLLCSSSNGF